LPNASGEAINHNLMYSKVVLIALTTLAIHATASAQKLPGKQEVSLNIPTNVKINGKADEWNNQFQAYDSATELKYTIANDDKNLYVIVSAEHNFIVQKALLQGVTISVSPLTKSDSKVGVTYPLENRAKGVFVNPALPRTDSLLKAINSKLKAQAKEMKITGIKGLTSEETSIYNEYDIQVAAAMDEKNAYTAELVIPLKYIDMEGKNGASLKYDIQLNAPTQRDDPAITVTQSADGKSISRSLVGSDGRTRDCYI
jgi:hypothetical protein